VGREASHFGDGQIAVTSASCSFLFFFEVAFGGDVRSSAIFLPPDLG